MIISDDENLFLGTDAGLVKFNGTHFTQCLPANGEIFGITHIHKHPKSGIYGLTFDGRIFLYHNHVMQQIMPDKKFIADYLIVEDSIYIIQDNNFIISDLFGKSFSIKNNFFNEGGGRFFINKEWILANNKLLNIITLQTIKLNHTLYRINWKKGVAIIDRSDNKIYNINQFNQLEQININSNQLNHLCFISTCSFPDNGGFINSFCGTLDIKQNRILFNDKVITDVEKDREGNYWFSTLGNGLILVPFPEAIEYKLKYSALNSRPDKLYSDENGNVFVMGVGQVYYIDGKSGKIIYSHEMPSKKECQTVFYDKDNKRLLFESGGLYAWNTKKPFNKPKYIGRGNIKTMFQSKLGIFFRGWNYFGLLVPVRDVEKIQQHWLADYLKPGEKIAGGYEEFIFTHLKRENLNARFICFNDSLETLYLAFSDELIKLTKHGILPVLIDKTNVVITAMDFDTDGSLIFSIKQKGIFKLNKHQKPELISNSPLITNSVVHKIIPHYDNYWLLTPNQIIKLNRNTHVLSEISSKDGLGNYEFRDIALHDDKLYIATNASIISLPLNIETEQKVAPLMNYFGVMHNGQPIDVLKHGVFPYKNNELNIQMEATNFRNRGNFFYKSFLKGYDPKEVFIPATTPSLTYRLLPPGDYELSIYAENSDGYKSNIFRYNFTIQAPFWQRWWFYFTLIILVAIIAYIIGYYYVSNVRRRNRLETQALESRLTSIKAQMNPHFIFNALGSIQYLVLRGEIKNANTYLGKFSKLMRQVLEMSELPAIHLSDEIQILELYLDLEKLRIGDNFSYDIKIGEGIRKETTLIPPLLLQPYVENAIRHGLLHKLGDKILSMEFIKNETTNTLQCIIKDNGIGMEASAQINQKSSTHKSFSSKANQARLQLYNERYPGYFSIEYSNIKTGGTEVTIYIPLDFKG
ncbi:MAG: histidine kinase [Flavobacteriales bacterium]|nr:histidine kinase [Flavobacteriales bacterium]